MFKFCGPSSSVMVYFVLFAHPDWYRYPPSIPYHWRNIAPPHCSFEDVTLPLALWRMSLPSPAPNTLLGCRCCPTLFSCICCFPTWPCHCMSLLSVGLTPSWPCHVGCSPTCPDWSCHPPFLPHLGHCPGSQLYRGPRSTSLLLREHRSTPCPVENFTSPVPPKVVTLPTCLGQDATLSTCSGEDAAPPPCSGEDAALPCFWDVDAAPPPCLVIDANPPPSLDANNAPSPCFTITHRSHSWPGYCTLLSLPA